MIVMGFPHLRNSTLTTRWVSLLSSSFRAALKSKSSLKLSVKGCTEDPLGLFGDVQELAQILGQESSVFFGSHVLSQVLEQIAKILETSSDPRRYLRKEFPVCFLCPTVNIFHSMSCHLGDCTRIVCHNRRIDPTIHCGIACLSCLIFYPVLKESGHLFRLH